MRVDWVSLLDFRSYKALNWSPDTGVNLLIGKNGAGKTNVLEAIGYLATLRSFRSAPDSALIRNGAESAVMRSALVSEQRERLIEIEVPRQGSRRTQVDKTRLKRTADLLGVVRVIAFLPEDLDLVKRGPAYRRNLLDEIAVQLWPASYLDQSEFERSLRQRNAFLKAGDHDEVTLSVWDSRLAQSAGRVLARRSRVIETLSPLFDVAYNEIAEAESTARFTYVPSWGGDSLKTASAAEYADLVSRALEGSRRRDYERRMTTVGPHRDEPGFSIGGSETRTHGSQGEQRTIALAVKLAAHRAVAEAVGEPPVLLLDDVFSELDPDRAAALAQALPDAQTLITSARPEDVPISGVRWVVEEGSIIES
ncbi:MAG: DNA replication/repair protein RecF [Actinomycetota bacterium]|nr:DNA replication/repair protein RecF [Actinomycetota bacterium]